MKFLEGKEKDLALTFIKLAGKQAEKATCTRAKGGSVVVKENKVLGEGFNSPPLELENQRRCTCDKNLLHRKITDKTCCIHAEQRAIFEALKNHSSSLKDSTIYFVNVDENGNLLFAGKPYCTICSKMALECGIKSFVLYHQEGICAYETDEYNLLSYKFTE